MNLPGLVYFVLSTLHSTQCPQDYLAFLRVSPSLASIHAYHAGNDAPQATDAKFYDLR